MADDLVFPDGLALPDRLNQDCFCIDIDTERVWAEIARAAPVAGLRDALAVDHAHLFSSAPVFVSRADIMAMEGVAAAIEAAAATPAYQAEVLARSPDIARYAPGPRGVFMGYDFHLTPEGPRLIEVNTNAGGAFLNALLARAQIACCPPIQELTDTVQLEAFDAAVWEMFLAEWRLQGRSDRPAMIAIVDDTPRSQYLYPEFLLAQAFFRRQGAEALILSPEDLSFEGGRLAGGGKPIDLVYNRLVDFDLSGAASQALRAAYLAGAVVLTPGPRQHALLADKRNLVLLSDPQRVAALGLDPAQAAHLSAIPKTLLVTAETADHLWSLRKSLFFKPAGGHAGKAVYRGDKMTRGVWTQILTDGGYVAQDFAPPSQRRVMVEADPQPRKLDVRLYTYGDKTLLAAARLYSGQTTNFRTPGGGFAPVVVLP